ncbi:hypothetical protein MTO96_012545 [Rhipicephalus appendiculatus]
MGQARPHNPEYARGRPFPHPSMRQPPSTACQDRWNHESGDAAVHNWSGRLFPLHCAQVGMQEAPHLQQHRTVGAERRGPIPNSEAPRAMAHQGHRVHPGDSSRQNPMGEVEELKRRLAQTEALLQQLLIRQSGGAQSASTNTNMSHSINLLVRELSKGTPRTPLRERHEGLRHRRPTHQTSEDEPACPCGAPLSSESCQGGSQPDSCSEGTAESGDEASLPLERETVAY